MRSRAAGTSDSEHKGKVAVSAMNLEEANDRRWPSSNSGSSGLLLLLFRAGLRGRGSCAFPSPEPGLNRGQPQVSRSGPHAHGLLVVLQQRFKFFLQSRIVSQAQGMYRSSPYRPILVRERVL